jgi:hypothetical protein
MIVRIIIDATERNSLCQLKETESKKQNSSQESKTALFFIVKIFQLAEKII